MTRFSEFALGNASSGEAENIYHRLIALFTIVRLVLSKGYSRMMIPVVRTPLDVARRVVAALLFFAAAQTGRTQERKTQGALFAQVNHSALVADLETTWTWSLSDSSNLLVKDAHLAVGLGNQLSPAHDALRGWVEWSPLSILDLRAGAEGVAYFGTFGHIVELSGYQSDFGDAALKKIADKAESRVGRRLYLSPAFKIRFGRFSFRTGADFEWWKLRNAPGSTFYEPIRATALASKGDSLFNISTVALIDASHATDEKFRVGLFHDYLEVWDAPQNKKQRLGPIVLVKLGPSLLGGRDPLLTAAFLRYLDAAHRDGFGGFVALTAVWGDRKPE